MELHPVETPLDKLSNRALDAIQAGRFQQAEQLCKKLLRVYRKAPDGHDRMAMLRMAEGRYEEAVGHYEKLLEMAQKNPEYFGPETVEYFTELRDQAQTTAARPAGQADSEAIDAPTADSHDEAHHGAPGASIIAGIARLFRGK